MSDTPELRRLRWSVPTVDTSTCDWLDAQHDISLSLRELIRASIQREGYIDIFNRRVERQPRRGRPPAEEQSMSSPARSSSPDDEAEQSESDGDEEEISIAEEPADALSTDAPESETEEVTGDKGSTSQVDMDAIFGHTA